MNKIFLTAVIMLVVTSLVYLLYLNEEKLIVEKVENVVNHETEIIVENVCEVDQVKNDATLEGLDSNHNGVRDDVECFIKETYEVESKEYSFAMRHAKSLQAVISNKILYSEEQLLRSNEFENEPIVQQHMDVIECLEDRKFLSELSALTRKMTNTRERGSRYASVFAGASGVAKRDIETCSPEYVWWSN